MLAATISGFWLLLVAAVEGDGCEVMLVMC
jgi:hypothetical protein